MILLSIFDIVVLWLLGGLLSTVLGILLLGTTFQGMLLGGFNWRKYALIGGPFLSLWYIHAWYLKLKEENK